MKINLYFTKVINKNFSPKAHQDFLNECDNYCRYYYNNYEHKHPQLYISHNFIYCPSMEERFEASCAIDEDDEIKELKVLKPSDEKKSYDTTGAYPQKCNVVATGSYTDNIYQQLHKQLNL